MTNGITEYVCLIGDERCECDQTDNDVHGAQHQRPSPILGWCVPQNKWQLTNKLVSNGTNTQHANDDCSNHDLRNHIRHFLKEKKRTE